MLPLKPFLRIDCRLTARPRSRDCLPVPVIDHVPACKDALDARHGVLTQLDITIVVECEAAVEEGCIGAMADGDKGAIARNI